MKDLLLDENGDLAIVNGDLLIGDASTQSVQLILTSKPGEWKEFPLVGCDIERALNGAISRFLEQNIRVQLEADYFKIEKLQITEKGIDLNGTYE